MGSLSECIGPISFKDSSISLMTSSGSSPENWELNFIVSELNTSRSSNLFFLVKDSCANDRNSVWGCTMISC